MKKMLFLLLVITLFSITGCGRDEVVYPLVVDEISDASYFRSTDLVEIKRYKVYLKEATMMDTRPYFYTTHLYQVGDTLK
jgi:hypothetical protein